MSKFPGYLLATIATATVLVGVFIRFSGLGAFSFAADEYFLAKSVENVLRFGLPAFECGGYYTRGLLHQYLAAGLQASGFSAEFAIRAVSAAGSLMALPAAYLLGRRTYGHTVGVLMVALMAISLWEVELARFGRMYAPFQAMFLWYLVFFLRYTVDRHKNSAWGMAILAVASVFVWEGGVFLGLANLLPPLLNHSNGRLSPEQWRYIGGMGLLFVPIYWFVTHDFRFQGDFSALPPNYDELVAAATPDVLTSYKPIFATLLSHPIWALVAIVPLIAAARALSWAFKIRGRWLAAAGIVVVLFAALLHQFLIVALILVLLLLCRLLRLNELKEQTILIVAILSAGLFWLAFALSSDDWRSAELSGRVDVAIGLVYQFFGFPDLLDMVARQSARVIPILALSLFLLVGAAIVRQVYSHQDETADTPNSIAHERALLVVGIVMLVLVGISEPPRTATRYFFFVYPLLLLVALGILRAVIMTMTRRDDHVLDIATIAIVSAWFVMTEDFNSYHLRNIATAEVNFRQHLPYKVRAHFIRRTDVQGVANWLDANANPITDLVISGNGVNALDAYYSSLSFIYVDPRDVRLREWSCNGGRTDRWSNLPLVYSLEQLRSRISSSTNSYLVIDQRRFDRVWPDVADLGASLAWENPNGLEAIIHIQPGPSVPGDAIND